MPSRLPTLSDPAASVGAYQDVIGLYDSDGGVPTYVLADVGAEDRWVSAATAATVDLQEWR